MSLKDTVKSLFGGSSQRQGQGHDHPHGSDHHHDDGHVVDHVGRQDEAGSAEPATRGPEDPPANP
jgi:hypothetical protein